jgi:hypothetical protein
VHCRREDLEHFLSMPIRESKRKELRTALMLMSGFALVMFLFVMVAKNFIAGPG